MNEILRGMYSYLADEIYKEWKNTEPKAVDVVRQMQDAKSDYALIVLVRKNRDRYSTILSILRYNDFVVADFELNELYGDMEFDDWYQSIDMNYAITQGILDELETDYVVNNEVWHDCYGELQVDEERIDGVILAIDLCR